MSHEIRTPMNAIIGFSELLLKMVTDKKHKNYLDSIQTAGKTLLTLINDILDIAKIEAGRLDIHYDPIDPTSIFNELKQLFSLKMNEKGLKFIIDIDKTLPPALLLDETRLRQVLLNLTSNAIKFTQNGHIKISIHQYQKDTNQIDLIIVVEDTGIGIPEDQQNKIFEAFQQMDGQCTRKYGGTGLGLAISKRLVEMMNGRISLKSQIGMGSLFEITLQDVKVSKVAPAVKSDNNFDVSRIYFEPAQILVVDDIESNRDVIRENLSQVNLEVIEAEDGQKGLLFAKEYQPALILMDLRMPVMDGYEATKQLKKNPKTQNIPVIALTASILGEHPKALNFDGFLFKPVQISKLLSKLSRYLKHTTQPVEALTEEREFETLSDSISPKLMEILEKRIIPQWQELQVCLDIEEIKTFANNIMRLGDKYQVPYLIHYGQKLAGFVQDLDVVGIEKTLTQFYKGIKHFNS